MNLTLAPDDSRVLTAAHSAGGVQEQYQYDTFGRVNQVSDGSTTLNYVYDDNGIKVSETTWYAGLPAGMLPPEIDYSYYPDGSLASISSPVGVFLYVYDLDGRLSQEGMPWGDIYNYSYDGAGHLQQKTVAYSTTTFTHNAVGELTELKNSTRASGQTYTLSDFANLHYDGAGNLTSETINYYPFQQGGPSSGTRQFSYDSEDRLTGEQDLFNLNSAGAPANGQYSFAYASDAADNLTAIRGQATTSNGLNQIQTMVGVGVSSFLYDLDGNTTSYNIADPVTGVVQNNTLAYDDSNELTGFGANTVAAYRPDGLRSWVGSAGGSGTFYIYSGETLLYELQGDANGVTPVRVYGWRATGIEQVSYPAASSVVTLLYDPQANVVSHQM